MKFRNFKQNEVNGLNIQFVMILDDARDIAKVPFIITSGFRTPDQNLLAGGREDSAHLKGLAVDLRCRDSKTRYAIINALLKVGFNRIEDGENHIHVDMDASKEQNVIFRK